jgi:excisionase family DNA binding protein
MRNKRKVHNEDVRLTYGVQEAGRLLGLSRWAAYEAVKSGSIPSIRIGGRLLVPKAALHRMLDSAGTAAS